MRRRLFEDLVVSVAKGGRTKRCYAFPVSAVFHAAVLCAAVVVPVLTQGALPDDVVHSAPATDVFLPPPPPPEGVPGRPPASSRGAAPREPRLEPAAPSPVEGPTLEPESAVAEEADSGPGCSGCVISGVPRDGVRGGEPGGTPGAAAAPQLFHVGGDIQPPRKVQHVNPVYPELARHAHVQGTVILECVIGPDGRVANVRILRSVPLLDAAAMDAVKQWRYEPTRLNGVPVALVMTVTVRFIIG